MKFNFLKRGIEEKHLKTYTLDYTTNNGLHLPYEVISRRELNSFQDITKMIPDSIVVIPFNKDHTKILLEKEFRPAVGDFVYNFPAGLIESGETSIDAAKRELKEETGLDVTKIITHLPGAFPSAGVCNELTELIICEAEGLLGGNPEANEEINVKWYGKDEVNKLITSNKFSARTQLFCYLWTLN